MLQDTYHQLWELLRAFIDLASAAAGAHALLLGSDHDTQVWIKVACLASELLTQQPGDAGTRTCLICSCWQLGYQTTMPLAV